MRVRLNPEESEQLNTFPSGTLFIKNPNHQLILTYTPHVAPDALFHDLKHLLTVNPMSTQTYE
ncbi:MAG: hypothetical protein B7X00_01825 [Legionella sp. 21-45-4]|nr:MAG: hypothetical protein B7X00_01825 [Legionella sp. 21-45-4]